MRRDGDRDARRPGLIVAIRQDVLVRGRSISTSIEEIEQVVRDFAAEVTADRPGEIQIRTQLYARRVLASLQSARTDLGTLALVIADDGT